MAAKTFTGARAKIYVDNVLVGLFESCSYSVNISAEPIHTLGRYGAQEIVPNSYEAITVNCSGLRIIDQSEFVLPKMPKLQDLLNLESVTLSITDRQTGENIMTVIGCVPVSSSGGYQTKSTSRIQITYMGIKYEDESGTQDEGDATSLP